MIPLLKNKCLDVSAPAKISLLIIILFHLNVLSVIAHDNPGQVPDIRALRVETPPVIDGRLDDACWQEAERITEFYQRNPRMGEPATFPLNIRIAYDSKTIYIGFEFHTGDPSQLISTVVQRDGSVNAYDDHFGFRFDTYHNHRDLYYFYINPKGTKYDGHAVDEGVKSDSNWDGVWEVKTSIMADGWAGEIALPLFNFRFPEADNAVWGFAGILYVSATQENVSWPDMRKTSRKPSLFGHITGLEGLGKQKPFVLIPYIIQGSKFGTHKKTAENPQSWKSVSDTWERDIGLDIRFRPTNNLETNIALNPDFATVEADQFLFNLTKDELQYPEKRPFFTEGQSRFETPIQLLYTRRIGLGEDEVIAGGKMHGRIGSVDFGVLDVVTGEGLDADNNYSALRLKKDILRSSTIGLLAVGKNGMSSDMKTLNSAVGLDLNLQIGRSSRLVGNIAKSSRASTDGNGYAGQLAYQYSDKLLNPSDNLNVSLAFNDATDDFDIQEIGYFGRTSLDRRGAQSGLGYSYWIKNRGINRVSARQNSWYYQNHAGTDKVLEGITGAFSIETVRLIEAGVSLEKSYYLLPDVPASYDNSLKTVFLDIGPYPRFKGEVSYMTGDNFGSAIQYIDSEIILKPSEKLRLTLNYSHLNSDPFDSNESTSVNDMVRAGFNYLFSPDIYWRIFLQSDSTDEIYLVNTLLRYEFRPGSVFYLSYKEIRDDTLGGFETSDRQLLGKISYHFHR